MSRAVSPSGGKPYGLARVCRVWRTARATVYRHRAPSLPASPRRRGPVGAMPDAALLEAIRGVLAASPFHGEGHRPAPSTARGTERSGRGCAMPGCAPPSAGCCG